MAYQNQGQQNNTQQDNKSLSFYITGTAGWNNMTEPTINDFKNYQYSIRVENPVFVNPNNDPEVQNMIDRIKNSPKMKQPTQQYPNPSIVLSLPAKRMDGTAQKPRYYDKASGMEIPVKNNIAMGQPITIVAGARDSNSSKYGFAVYLNGIIFDDANKVKWYTQASGNPLLAGFTPLSAQQTMNTPANSETNVMFDNAPAANNAASNNTAFNTNQAANQDMPNNAINTQMSQSTQPMQNGGMVTNGMTNQMPGQNMNQTAPQTQMNPAGQTQMTQSTQPMQNGGMVANGMANQMPGQNMNQTAPQTQMNPAGQTQMTQSTQPMQQNSLNNPAAAWNQGQNQAGEVPFPEQNGTNNDPTPNTNSAQDYFNHNA